MTANLSSFLRFKYNSKGQANEEQDLQGFDTMVVKPKDKLMGTIQEGPDETSPDSHGKRPSGGGGIMPYSNGAMRCVPGARGSDERGDRRSLKCTRWEFTGGGSWFQGSAELGRHEGVVRSAVLSESRGLLAATGTWSSRTSLTHAC